MVNEKADSAPSRAVGDDRHPDGERIITLSGCRCAGGRGGQGIDELGPLLSRRVRFRWGWRTSSEERSWFP